MGVESTARQAYDQGLNVVLVADAMTDRDATAHQYSVEKVFPRLGEITTTADVLAKLNGVSAQAIQRTLERPPFNYFAAVTTVDNRFHRLRQRLIEHIQEP